MLSQNIVLCGQKIRVWTNGQGPSLLLIHSAWGDAEMNWSPAWEGLARGFRVIAPDLPGFGESEPLSAPTLARYAAVLRELLERLQAEKAVTLGNSFGAAVAAELASSFPGSVSRLVMMNGTKLPFVPALMRKIILLPAVRMRFQAAMRKATYSDRAFELAFPDQSALPPGFIARIRAGENKHAPTVFSTFMNQSRAQRRPTVPAAIIWGTGDRLTGRRMATGLRTWLGEPLFVPIEGAGHMPQVERPREFVDAVLKATGEVMR
jgi:pimeloyl-ACP methyl ester carboxylesterase